MENYNKQDEFWDIKIHKKSQNPARPWFFRNSEFILPIFWPKLSFQSKNNENDNQSKFQDFCEIYENHAMYNFRKKSFEQRSGYDFTPKMTIKAGKWKFSNFSEFTLQFSGISPLYIIWASKRLSLINLSPFMSKIKAN